VADEKTRRALVFGGADALLVVYDA
jgi:hypothetical protein